MQARAMYLMLAALASLAAVAAIMLSNRAPGPDDSHLWMGDVRAASWSPPPDMRVDDGRQSYETGCPLGSDTDRSGPLVKAWIDALNEANITFLAAGSEALRALRFGSNTVRLGSDHLGLAAHPRHGIHDLDLFAVFPDKMGLSAAYSWLFRKFAGHPEFECYGCAGSCRVAKKQCCCLRWRNPPAGQEEAGYDWQWTKQIEMFNAIVHNQTHLRLKYDPVYDVPIGRVFPLRHARFGPTVTIPVAHDFMWFLSNQPMWAGTTSQPPRYGQGCRSVAYPTNVLNAEVFGITEWKPQSWDTYGNVRRVEKGTFQCAKWLHQHGFASFYGCFDEDIGFGEPEDYGLQRGTDWSNMIHPRARPLETKSFTDRVLG